MVASFVVGATGGAGHASVGMGQLMGAVLLTLFACAPIGLSLWALLDAVHRPQWAWALAGRRQVLWLVAILFGMFTLVGGLVLSLWYLLRVRPAIAAIERGDLGTALDHGPG